MKRILIAAVMLGLGGGAYAADFADLQVFKASDVKSVKVEAPVPLKAVYAGAISVSVPIPVKPENYKRLEKAPSQHDLQSFLDAPVANYGITNKDLLLSRYPVYNVVVSKTFAGRFVLKVQYVLGPGKTPEMVEPKLKENLLGTVPGLARFKDFIVFEALS